MIILKIIKNIENKNNIFVEENKMKEKQTELEKVYKKNKFYSNFFKISTFIFVPSLVGTIYWGFKINTDLELEKRIKELNSNMIQVEKLSPEIKYLYNEDKTNDLDTEVFINDLVEKYKNEISVIKKDPLYLLEQNTKKENQKMYNLFSYLSIIMAWSTGFSLVKTDKYNKKFKELKKIESEKIKTSLDEYTINNDHFSKKDLCEHLKKAKLQPQYFNLSFVENHLNKKLIFYDEKKEEFYKMSDSNYKLIMCGIKH